MKNLAEVQRLTFISERDGINHAIAFAKRSLRQYREVARDKTMLRRNLVLSCLSFREFLILNKSYMGAK